jgi:hypothetical protein
MSLLLAAALRDDLAALEEGVADPTAWSSRPPGLERRSTI